MKHPAIQQKSAVSNNSKDGSIKAGRLAPGQAYTVQANCFGWGPRDPPKKIKDWRQKVIWLNNTVSDDLAFKIYFPYSGSTNNFAVDLLLSLGLFYFGVIGALREQPKPKHLGAWLTLVETEVNWTYGLVEIFKTLNRSHSSDTFSLGIL